MQKMKKCVSLVLACLLMLALGPVQVFAQGNIDLTADIKLNISYKDKENGKSVPGAQFDIYRVADVDTYARMTLTEDFAALAGSVTGLSDLESMTAATWLQLAATLKGKVELKGLKPQDSGLTDENGLLSFPSEGKTLPAGLYLVVGYRATTDDYYTYSCTPFMVLLPNRNDAENTWDYELTVQPKSSKDYNPPDVEEKLITRKVMKVWDDEGYEEIRPEGITVYLLCDGKVFDKQTLNEKNNWRYAWDNLDPKKEWTVVEEDLDEYSVISEKTGITYVLSNKYIAPITGVDPPVQKRVIGDKPYKKGTFVFTLTALDPSYPMPAGSIGTTKTMEIVGPGSKEFGDIFFVAPGEYSYKIAEKDTNEKGYTYDSEVYTVTFVVTEENGELKTETRITKSDGSETSKVEFTNEFKEPELPFTGSIWWPVPVLLCLGVVFLAVGALQRRREE